MRRVELGPLPPSAAGELVDAAGAAELELLYRASGGNPFYLLQLARGGGGDHGARREGEVPPAVVAAIVAELDGLTATARRFAEAAAVAGDPFELDLTVATAGVDDGDALDAIDELAARDLVRPGEVPRRFGFRHPLVRSAVYESTAAGARLAAHGRAARALAERGAPASARAHHVAHRLATETSRRWRCCAKPARGRPSGRRPARRNGSRLRSACCPRPRPRANGWSC